MRHRRHAAFVAFAVLAASLPACGGTDFAGASGRAGGDAEDDDKDLGESVDSADGVGVVIGQDAAGRDIKRREEDFRGDTSKAPIDMVWVIDNSGSMSDKIQQVELNLNRFLTSVRSQADLSVAVVTDVCDGSEASSANPFGFGGLGQLCLRVDASAGTVKTIDVNVGSYNPLAILAAAEAPSGAFTVQGDISPGDGFFGGQATNAQVLFNGAPLPEVAVTGGDFAGSRGMIEGPDMIQLASGKLQGFFRPGGAKVVVMVSDEDEFTIGAVGYDQVVAALGPQNASYTFFGFVGTTGGASAGPMGGRGCSPMQSAQYPVLAQKTGGQVYDVCLPDWTSSFDQLTKDVIAATKHRFPLAESGATRVVSVTVNGIEQPPSAYTLDGGALVFTSGAIGADASVHVVYEYVGD